MRHIKLYFYECVNMFKKRDCSFNVIFVNIFVAICPVQRDFVSDQHVL